MTPSEHYLAEVARALPRLTWRADRILEEIEEHLRLSAADVGEEEAIRRFGRPQDVVRGFRPGRAALLAAAAVLVVLALPIVGYPLVENTLPPAPWPEAQPPQHLHWKEDWAVQLFVLAAVTAIVGSAMLARRRSIGLLLLSLAALALVAMGALGTVLSVQWSHTVPGTPWWHTVLGAAFLAAAGASSGLLGRATLLAFRPPERV